MIAITLAESLHDEGKIRSKHWTDEWFNSDVKTMQSKLKIKSPYTVWYYSSTVLQMMRMTPVIKFKANNHSRELITKFTHKWNPDEISRNIQHLALKSIMVLQNQTLAMPPPKKFYVCCLMNTTSKIYKTLDHSNLFMIESH